MTAYIAPFIFNEQQSIGPLPRFESLISPAVLESILPEESACDSQFDSLTCASPIHHIHQEILLAITLLISDLYSFSALEGLFFIPEPLVRFLLLH